MRIIHGIHTLDPDAGGPPLVASRLAAAQAAQGHEVSIVSYELSDAAAARTRASLASVPGADAVRLRSLAPPTGVERFWPRVAASQLTEQIRAADVVHLHGVWEPILTALAAAARRAHVPYVVTPHGMLDPWAMQQSRLKKRVALLLGYRRMLDRASFLHMLNVDEARLVQPLRLRAGTEVIGNGVFLEEVEPLPPRGSFYARFPSLGGRPYVLFLSRLHFKKGLDHLGAAFTIVARQVPEVRLVVAGPDGGARADFERAVAQQGLTDRVHVVGPLYGTQKLEAFGDACCFCLPSRQEGFSVAITEAMACGVPVVISDACHFPEVREAAAGRIVPLEPAAIAEALIEIVNGPVTRQAMSAAGAALVRSRYTWPKIATQMLRAYEAQAARRAGARWFWSASELGNP